MQARQRLSGVQDGLQYCGFWLEFADRKMSFIYID
jgi:hypothetical protein